MPYLNLVSIFIAMIALAVSIATYLLNRKLPNENKIFEEKINCYHAVIKAMSIATSTLFGCLNQYNQDTKVSAEQLNELLDHVYFSLEDRIGENSLVIPNDILAEIYAFLDVFDDEKLLTMDSKPEEIDQLDDAINEAFDQVIVAMQNDLGFEKLDKSLKRRTGGLRRPFKSSLR